MRQLLVGELPVPAWFNLVLSLSVRLLPIEFGISVVHNLSRGLLLLRYWGNNSRDVHFLCVGRVLGCWHECMPQLPSGHICGFPWFAKLLKLPPIKLRRGWFVELFKLPRGHLPSIAGLVELL